MSELSGERFTITRVASGDFNASEENRYRFCILVGRDFHLAGTAGAVVHGVNQQKNLDNDHGQLAVMGMTKITLGESIGPQVFVTTNNSGYAVRSVDSADYIPGVLLTGADSGGVGEMLMTFTGSGLA